MNTEFTSHPQKIIYGIRKSLIRAQVRLYMADILFRTYRKPLLCFNLLIKLARHRKEISGEKIRKLVHVDGRYFWDLYVPGYKSSSIKNFFEGEANRIIPASRKTARFNNVMVAITKRCPLRCEHCFEWESLNGSETLSLNDLKNIISKFQEKGTGQIQLTGGEPLLRKDDLIELIRSSKPGTDFWIFTSGFNLTSETAQKLKEAGLTGVVISLDHFNPESHNQFRGNNKSFEWVMEGARNSIDAGLVTALSLCVTRSFVSWSNLLAYAELAKKIGVSFIQVLEPKTVGHYKGKDVNLEHLHEKILEDFFLKMNNDKQYREFPIICYHGYYQRRVGCFGAGNRSIYVDTDGDIMACPFCRTKTGNVLTEDLDRALENLQAAGCRRFETSRF